MDRNNKGSRKPSRSGGPSHNAESSKVSKVKSGIPNEEFSIETLLFRVGLGGVELGLYKKVVALLRSYSIDSEIEVEMVSFKYGELTVRCSSEKARLVRTDRDRIVALVNKSLGAGQCTYLRVTSAK